MQGSTKGLILIGWTSRVDSAGFDNDKDWLGTNAEKRPWLSPEFGLTSEIVLGEVNFHSCLGLGSAWVVDSSFALFGLCSARQW